NASGTGTCSGGANESLPLASDIYLTGPTDGLVPCPLCTGAGPTCSAGPNAGQPCVPESSAIPGQSPAANPPSHDCPPASSAFVGTLPISFSLSVGTQSRTSVDQPAVGVAGAQSFVFFGFCGDGFSNFANPPKPCNTNADCAAVAGNTACRQRTSGAFRVGP